MLLAEKKNACAIEGNFRTCLIQTGANCFLQFDFQENASALFASALGQPAAARRHHGPGAPARAPSAV